MDELVELIGSLNITKLKSSGLWRFIFEPESLMEQLCEAIHTGRVRSDEDAAALLYPGQKPGAKLINLRERLQERIISVVFLLEFRAPGGTDRQKAYFDCNRKWSAAMVLLSKNAKRVSISMMEDLLKQTLHFEFTELSLSILSALRLHYGTIHGNLDRYNMYRSMYQQHQEVWMMENEAEDNYTHLVSYFVNSKSSKTSISDKAREYFESVQQYMERSESFRLHLCGRMIQVMIHSSKNDYAATARVCEEAITFFKGKTFESNLPLQAFYYQLIVCYIQLKEFEKGEVIIQQYQTVFEEGSFNWYKLQELFFLLATYTQHYDAAFDVCENVQAKIRSNNALPTQITEMWKIYEAYSYYLVTVGKITLPEGHVARFKLKKFLNDIPTYSKDKQGMNIPILIIQTLFAISEQNYHQSIDRIEAVEKYCGRYLKQNETFRSHCFIKALLQIPAASFHREAVIRKAQKFIDQLHKLPLDVAYQTHEIEIIPYEHLWEMALEALPGPSARGSSGGR
ncbi:MAG: hypothetical protein LCH81_14600 [Bacteroidetes bacterium]|nr:hypothetical protein [Bacteroidota bacterium]